MKKGLFVTGVVAVLLLVLLAAAAAWLTSTLPEDECSAAHRRCAAMAEGVVAAAECRLEVYHCRRFGHFEFPDGTRQEFGDGVR